MSSMIREYLLEEKAGSGAVGVVYKARHTVLNRIVAVKVLHQYHLTNSDLRDRFFNEAKTMSGLSHPNIVSLYDYVTDGDTLALVMEFIEGRPLDEMIARETGPISFERALHLFKQMLEGMSYAHARGMIHRDIKPSNIMVTTDSKVKILDLGLALAKDSKRLTQDDTKMGTLFYMAPELLHRPNHSVQSDIYALAMTLYEMLTGIMPLELEGQSYHSLINRILNEELPDPRIHYPYIPIWLVQLLQKCLRKDPAERYSSCDDILLCIESNEGNEDFGTVPEVSLPHIEKETSTNYSQHTANQNKVPSHTSNVLMRSILTLFGAFLVYLLMLQLILGVFN